MVERFGLGAGALDLLVNTLARRVRDTPDQLAYGFLRSRGAVLEPQTYESLGSDVRRLAAYLLDATDLQEPVGCLLDPGLPFIAAFLACLSTGRIAVPLPPPRGLQAWGNINTIIAHAGVRSCFFDPRTNVTRELATTNADPSLCWLDITAHAGDLRSEKDVEPEHIAYLQYTSGSTGAPKGVMVTHGNLAANSLQIEQAFGHDADSIGVIWLPPYHDMGLVGGILQPLHAGFPTYLMAPDEFVRSPLTWLQAIAKYRGTTSGGPNFAYDHCVNRISADRLQGLDLSSWQVAFSGAERVSPATLQRFHRVFGPHGFRFEAFTPCYGLAESTLMVTCADRSVAPTWSADPAAPVPHVSCGRAHDPANLIVVDPATGEVAAPGHAGEIWVKGPSVSPGYWRDTAATLEVFGASVAGATGRYLRTGDIGRIENGDLHVCGRAKAVVIIRGVNYRLEDFELAAGGAHARIDGHRTAAFVVDDCGSEQLVLLQEAPNEVRHGSLASEVITAIKARVGAAFGVQPHDVRLTRAGEIPKTRSGKVRRDAAKGLYLEMGRSVPPSPRAGGLRVHPGSTSEASQQAVTEV